jgi:NAD-dependent SIR2 family protein deacetylase
MQEAIDWVLASDVLLLTSGAGLSADSGLPVFADIAKVPAYLEKKLSYTDLCNPKWIEEDPSLFYGFYVTILLRSLH